MKTLRSALAVLAVAVAVYPVDSRAVLVLVNGTTEIEWYVGQPVPSIDLAPAQFAVAACGAELTWVYENFPTIPMRTIGGTTLRGRSAIATQPPENQCVLWRGDNARFIADNLAVGGN